VSAQGRHTQEKQTGGNTVEMVLNSEGKGKLSQKEVPGSGNYFCWSSEGLDEWRQLYFM